MKILLRPTLVICFFALVVVGIPYFLLSQSNQNNKTQTTQDILFGWKYPVAKFPSTGSGSQLLAYSDIRDPGGMPRGLPVRLLIPAIGVNSAIEDALITPDGRMDVPIGSRNVAWFALGPHPGQEGSAVIGGHYGINNGLPFVFYKLDKLTVGDKIYIKDDEDKTLVFVVRSSKLFDRNADATDVFTSNDGVAHLNLIACEGVWNQVNNTYPERRVVFADAVSVQNIAEPIFVFSRTLSIGSKGEDVVALQTILEQKEFLVMPAGVKKGFFGVLTRDAVSQYQASVDLPQVGSFDSSTRAKFISDSETNPVLPDAGVGGISASGTMSSEIKAPSYFQMVTQLVNQYLYSTKLDGLITSLLLVLIAFVIFKIITL
ncbi:MAG: sortase [Candidatus Paceibacterota bacterium]|jgi:LPXTG-site transpeptidase (sortase) family protein